MSIVFKCEECGKRIEAKDSMGGKWGKCPSCHHKVYVPPQENPGEEDELRVAPLDDSEEQRRQQLISETYQLEHKILSETETPPEGAEIGEQQLESIPAFVPDEKELTKAIIMYIRYTADGELQQAQELIGNIKAGRSKANKIIDQIALSEIPEPELSDIPPQVLSGIIRTLRSEIG